MDHIPIGPRLTHSGKKESQTPSAMHESGGSKAKEPVCTADTSVVLLVFGVSRQTQTQPTPPLVRTSTTAMYSAVMQ